MNQRSPRFGDMIIRNISRREHLRYPWFDLKDKYIGLVREIERIETSRAVVFVEWTNGEAPPDYDGKYGYSSTNVHNLYREFDIVRDGIAL